MKGRRLALLVIALLVISAGLWWGLIGSKPSGEPANIDTSGFIEATSMEVALEAGGTVSYLAVQEGDAVAAGVPLVKLDDAVLLAQQQQAEAGLALVQAELEVAKVNTQGARKAWEDALEVQDNPLEMEGRLLAAESELEMAELNVDILNQRLGIEWWQRRIARLNLELAQKAYQHLLLIKENPQEINAAVDQAGAAYQSAVAREDAARYQVDKATADLALLSVQMAKLSAGASFSGVVAGRYAEVGEVIPAGKPVLTVIRLDQVTLTTYVPESQIGRVRLGQTARVTVDSYPAEDFTGQVAYLSPQAVFTPGNVQLKEEREKTVFAVKIRLANPEQKLKPGMPADATIMTGAGG
ncbi:MAG: efflux RND transporter periplasmic adaptor subunit [Chloroflexota bacterium]